MAKQTDPLARARAFVLTALTVEVAALVLTGIVLFFVYVPTDKQAWGDLATASYDGGTRLALAVRLLHRFVSVLAFPTAIAGGVLVALRGRPEVRRPGERRAPGVALAVVTPLTVVAAAITGFLLPWDQLALKAVRVGSNLVGYRVLLDDDLRFVLVGGWELTPGTVMTWLLIHTLVVGSVVGGLVWLGWRRHRAISPASGTP